MEYLYALLLNFFEMTFIFVALILLCNQRKKIGASSFCMSVALLMFFGSLISAADIRTLLIGNLEFQISENVIYLPTLVAFLMVYITMGLLAAQRLLIGTVVSFVFFIYLCKITQLQCNWSGFFITSGLSAVTLDNLLNSNRYVLNITAVMRLLDMVLLPMIYNQIKGIRHNRFWGIVGALFGIQLIGMLPFLIIQLGAGQSLEVFNGDFFVRIFTNLYLGTLLTCYLNRMETEIQEEQHSPLDFIFSFFGSYSRAKELENDLREWENRYQLVLQNAGELILMLDDEGKIVDANITARNILNFSANQDLSDLNFWEQITILEPTDFSTKILQDTPTHFQAATKQDKSREVIIAASLTTTYLRSEKLRIIIARDITEEMRLTAEKAALTEQLIHSQRLESLGILAGGIAHDFNNYIHAIMGNVDNVLFFKQDNPIAIRDHLEKIGRIAEQAGNLTSQLLGFARLGKYHVVEVDLGKLVDSCISLLGPQKLISLTIQNQIAFDTWFVSADRLQLQQVILNMLLNAVDALEKCDNQTITLNAGVATNAPLTPVPAAELAEIKLDEYLYFTIEDNGCGMDEDTKNKIFEPFFTTKPVGVGTGMGLAMVYGTITHHKGWIQIDSTIGKGTCFYIFLPKYPKRCDCHK